MIQSTLETRAAAKRWLFLNFAMFGRETKVQTWVKTFRDVVRDQQSMSNGPDADLFSTDASIREATRILDAEDEKFWQLQKATNVQLLDAAKENMKAFDHTARAPSPSVSILAAIDPAIRSPDASEEYFEVFKDKYLHKQTHILAKLIAACGDHADIHDFTRNLLDCLRRSDSYEPSVHGKLQREFLRVEKGNRKKGRPASIGSYILRRLIVQVAHDYQLPKTTAAKIVQEVMRDVLVPVRDAGGETVHYGFIPTDSAIKNILEKQ